MSFQVKDSGERMEYASGMVRDTQDGKPDYSLIFDGPLVDRLAQHLTLGADKYGKRNWQLANSDAEMERFRASAVRHFRQWLRGDRDEDHFSATVFNMNAVEYVKGLLGEQALYREIAAANKAFSIAAANKAFTLNDEFAPGRSKRDGSWPHMRDTMPLRSAKRRAAGCEGCDGQCRGCS